MIKVSQELFLEIRNFKEFDFNYTYNVLTKEIERGLESFYFICKEWALEKGLDCNSGYDFDNELYNCQIFSYKQGMEIKYILADTEIEAVVKSCQWILDNKA